MRDVNLKKNQIIIRVAPVLPDKVIIIERYIEIYIFTYKDMEK